MSALTPPEGERVGLQAEASASVPETLPGTDGSEVTLTRRRGADRTRYLWFNLGMAPLAGIEARQFAPLWAKAGAWLYRHGEHFYNYQGLRQYKEKFDPVWEPRYLASPGGLALPHILVNVAALISGGLTGVVRKLDRSRATSSRLRGCFRLSRCP